MRGRGRLLWAIAASCAVYVLPIVTVHWGDLFGLSLWRELSSDRGPTWIAADLTLAVVVQFAWGLLVWFALRFGRVAGVAVFVLASVPAVASVNMAYLVSIPELFLIERDDTPDTATLELACTAAAELDASPAGITRGLDARGQAIVRVGGTGYGILRVPDCSIEPVAIPQLPIAPGINQVLPDGTVVYSAYERGVPGQTFWLLRRGAATGTRLVPPPEVTDTYPVPLVSEDGLWVAWSLRSPARVVSVLVQPLGGGEPIRFTHDLLQQATLTLVELDMTHRTITVNRDLSTFVALSLDGSVAWGPVTPPDVRAQNSTFRYADGQWLAWDAYVENRAYRAAWSTMFGTGSYQIPKGRTVTAGALSPSGRYVAISTTTDLNIGSVQDTVLVRRTDTGADVFRRTLRKYTRSHVTFLGDHHVAYTDVDGGAATVHVLKLPE